MIFSSMEYPGKDYRVQVVDAWLGETFEPMDNPKDGDKIVYRIIGENGQPVEQKTEVYQNGAWVEQGGGGSSDFTTANVTLINNDAGEFMLSVPNVVTGEMDYVSPVFSVEEEQHTILAVLYKGQSALVYVPDDFSVSVSGNAQDFGGTILISGDCSLTFSLT